MKSMAAEVAIKTLFSMLKAAMVTPRMAPPVPKSPAEKPNNDPPIAEFSDLRGALNFYGSEILN
mgnify:CR=1 FL=1